LQALRDLAQKQNDQATRSAEERAKSHTLSAAERVELESKKAEIARIEQVTSMNAERTASTKILAPLVVPHRDLSLTRFPPFDRDQRHGRSARSQD
jgi:hypothetical protein